MALGLVKECFAKKSICRLSVSLRVVKPSLTYEPQRCKSINRIQIVYKSSSPYGIHNCMQYIILVFRNDRCNIDSDMQRAECCTLYTLYARVQSRDENLTVFEFMRRDERYFAVHVHVHL